MMNPPILVAGPNADNTYLGPGFCRFLALISENVPAVFKNVHILCVEGDPAPGRGDAAA